MSNNASMSRMEINKVGIVGCGLMGSGFTQLCAVKGYDVVVSEKSEDLLVKGLDLIKSRLTESVAAGGMSEKDKDTAVARIPCSI